MAPRFSLHRRKSRWYAQLWSVDLGKYLSAKCTGQTTRNMAMHVVSKWIDGDCWPGPGRKSNPRPLNDAVSVGTLLGQLRSAPLTPEDAGKILDVLRSRDLIDGGVAKGGPGSEMFTDFLTRFWTYDTSPYVREKHAHGKTLGRRRCIDALGRIAAHVEPFFKGKRLAEIVRADLSDFGTHLKGKTWEDKSGQKHSLMAKSINNTVEPVMVALRWAFNNGLVLTNPAERGTISRFSGATKARGVLTPEEAGALFGVAWKDERSRVGSLLAMTTGLRNGEVLALQVRDLAEDRIHVRHSWSETDLLKAPKTNETRTVPLIPEVRAEVLALVALNPHELPTEEDDRFIFYSADPGRPMKADVLRVGLEAALDSLGIDRKGRGVVFHSWRHYYSSRMSDVAEERVVRLATGHASAMMHQHYSSHVTEELLEKARAAAVKVFAFPGAQGKAVSA